MNSAWEIGFLAGEGALGCLGKVDTSRADACKAQGGTFTKKGECRIPPGAAKKAERDAAAAKAKADREAAAARAKANADLRKKMDTCGRQGGHWNPATNVCEFDPTLRYSAAQCRSRDLYVDPATGQCLTTKPSPVKPSKPGKPDITQAECRKMSGSWDRTTKTCAVLGPPPGGPTPEEACAIRGGTWAQGQCVVTGKVPPAQAKKTCKAQGGKWNASRKICVVPGQAVPPAHGGGQFEPLPPDVITDVPPGEVFPMQTGGQLLPAKNRNQCKKQSGIWDQKGKLCYASQSVKPPVSGTCFTGYQLSPEGYCLPVSAPSPVVNACPAGYTLSPDGRSCLPFVNKTGAQSSPAFAEAQAACVAGGGSWQAIMAQAVAPTPSPLTGGGQPATWETAPEGTIESQGSDASFFAGLRGLRGLAGVSAEASALLQAYCRCSSGYPFDVAAGRCQAAPAPTPAPPPPAPPTPAPYYPPYSGGGGVSYPGGPMISSEGVSPGMFSPEENAAFGVQQGAGIPSECSAAATFPKEYSDDYGPMRVLQVVCPQGSGEGAAATDMGPDAGPIPGMKSAEGVTQAEMQDLFGGSPEMAWAGI